MKFNPKEIFCELISGLSFICYLAPLFHLFDILSFAEMKSLLDKITTVEFISIFLIITYVLGILMDAIGLTIGSGFLDDKVSNNEPSGIEYQEYWKNVNDKLSAYREEQWTYYSCFRNVFINLIPILVSWLFVLGFNKGFILLLVTLILLGICLFFSMRTLLRLYYRITRYDLSGSGEEEK